MEPTSTFPICAPAPSDVIPILVIAGVFLLGGWLIRRRRKKRGSRPKKT